MTDRTFVVVLILLAVIFGVGSLYLWALWLVGAL